MVVPSPLPAVKSIPPWSFPAAAPRQATFPGLSRVWTPSRPCRHQPGTWPESTNSSFFPASFALLKRARICSATERGTQRTGSSPTPSMFQMRHRGPEKEKVSQDHWLRGRSWETLDAGIQPAICTFCCPGQSAQCLRWRSAPSGLASFIISPYLLNTHHLPDIKHLTYVITFNPHNSFMIYLLVLPLSLLFSFFRRETETQRSDMTCPRHTARK